MSLYTIPLSSGGAAQFDSDDLAIYLIPAGFTDLPDQGGATCVNAPQAEAFSYDPNSFDTLILHISNDCNMGCGYCFAGKGSYHSKADLMTVDTAVHVLETFLNRYSKIREVKLFGGEPFLNPNVMEAVGRYIQDYPGYKPVIKVITNGTILSKRHKRIILDYQIKVVFSIDGPPEIHDAGRVFRNGGGTFQKVYENFQALRTYTDQKQPYSIDVTYSGFHEKKGQSVNDVVWYLTDLFGIKPSKINVSVISALPGSPYSLADPMCMVKSAKAALEKARAGDSRTHMKLRSVIRRLKNRILSGDSVCDACRSWAAVSYAGELYPCLMFMDREEYAMGSVSPELFSSEQYIRVYDRFQYCQKKTQAPCCDCIAKNVCVTCMGINEYYTGDLHTSSPTQCQEMCQIVQTAIQGIAEGIW